MKINENKNPDLSLQPLEAKKELGREEFWDKNYKEIFLQDLEENGFFKYKLSDDTVIVVEDKSNQDLNRFELKVLKNMRTDLLGAYDTQEEVYKGFKKAFQVMEELDEEIGVPEGEIEEEKLGSSFNLQEEAYQEAIQEAIKAFQLMEELDKKAVMTEREIEEEKLDKKSLNFWAKAKNALSNPELGKQVAKALTGAAASILGVKAVYDVPTYFRQRLSVSKDKKEFVSFFKELEKQGVDMSQEIEKEKQKQEALEKEDQAGAYNLELSKKKIGELIDLKQVDKLEAKIDNMDASEEIKDKLTEELNVLLENYHQEYETLKENKNQELTQTLDKYIKTKISGIQATKEAVNSACVTSSFFVPGAMALRGIVFGGASILERHKRLKEEGTKEKKQISQAKRNVDFNKGEILELEEDVKQKIKALVEKKESQNQNKAKISFVKDTILKGIAETGQNLVFQSRGSKFEKGAKFAKSLGSLARFGGIGYTTYSSISPFIEDILEKLEDANLFVSKEEIEGTIESASQSFDEGKELEQIHISDKVSIDRLTGRIRGLGVSQELQDKLLSLEVDQAEKIIASGIKDQEILDAITENNLVEDWELRVGGSDLSKEIKLELLQNESLRNSIEANPSLIRYLEKTNSSLVEKIISDGAISGNELEIIKSSLPLEIQTSLLDVSETDKKYYLNLLKKLDREKLTEVEVKQKILVLINNNNLSGLKEYLGEINALTQVVEQGDNLTKISRKILEDSEISDEVKDTFINRYYPDHKEITDYNRAELLEQAINKMSVSNLELDGNDVQNLIYEGNEVYINSETGAISVKQGDSDFEAKIVSERDLRENWADQRAKDLGLDPDKVSFGSQDLTDRDISIDLDLGADSYEVIIDKNNNWQAFLIEEGEKTGVFSGKLDKESGLGAIKDQIKRGQIGEKFQELTKGVFDLNSQAVQEKLGALGIDIKASDLTLADQNKLEFISFLASKNSDSWFSEAKKIFSFIDETELLSHTKGDYQRAQEFLNQINYDSFQGEGGDRYLEGLIKLRFDSDLENLDQGVKQLFSSNVLANFDLERMEVTRSDQGDIEILLPKENWWILPDSDWKINIDWQENQIRTDAPFLTIGSRGDISQESINKINKNIEAFFDPVKWDNMREGPEPPNYSNNKFSPDFEIETGDTEAKLDSNLVDLVLEADKYDQNSPESLIDQEKLANLSEAQRKDILEHEAEAVLELVHKIELMKENKTSDPEKINKLIEQLETQLKIYNDEEHGYGKGFFKVPKVALERV